MIYTLCRYDRDAVDRNLCLVNINIVAWKDEEAAKVLEYNIPYEDTQGCAGPYETVPMKLKRSIR